MKKDSVFWISIAIASVIIIGGYLFADTLTIISAQVMELVSYNFGWLYTMFVAFICIFLVWLAFGKYGNVRLGKNDEVPQYSNFTWFAMLFCGGTGIGLVFWSIAEPLSHFVSPPPGIQAGTIEAIFFSMRTCFLHWGVTQWACFAIVGLEIAYFQFRKNKTCLCSVMISPLFGNQPNSVLSKAIDIFTIVVSFCGVATSLGLGVSQICGGLNFLYDVPNTKTTWFIIICIITIIFFFSAMSGVNVGIKRLSNLNTCFAFFLLFIAYAVSPKIEVLNVLTNSLGQHFQNFAGDLLMMTPFQDNSWIMNWRVFYYAWFIAWTPFVGMFIARISRGRTIREFIIGVVVMPTVFTIIWLSVFGTIAFSSTSGRSLETVANLVAEPQTAVFLIFENYPFSELISIVIIVLLGLFFITSADSATYSLSVMSSKGDLNPPTYKKAIWAVIVATIAYVLLSAGSIKPLQTISIAASLPFLFIMIISCPAFLKALRED